ncbi:MAG: EVE domain-containing protein [Alphaproteobacteria bacterium]
MAYWLYKSEPHAWSWDDQVKAGKKGTEWDGVRNYAARNHMRDMKKGDRGFFYHSGAERLIVGIVEVVAETHADSTTDDARWECVDLAAVGPVPEPVSLAAIKGEPRLADMALARLGRLSVQPVTDAQWKLVCKMGGV